MLIQALANLAPGASFEIVGDETLANLKWLDPSVVRPDDSTINAEMTRLKTERELTEYQRRREEEYPNKDDLLIALWEMVVEGRTASAEELQALRKEIKAKHPKPEVSR